MNLRRWIRWTWRDLVDATYGRIKYGCNPQDIWNLDSTFAAWVIPRLKLMRDKGHGVPNEVYNVYHDEPDETRGKLAAELWRVKLNGMIRGFEIIADGKHICATDDSYFVAAKVAIDMFHKYYFDLWD
jgi:hypothetical protein